MTTQFESTKMAGPPLELLSPSQQPPSSTKPTTWEALRLRPQGTRPRCMSGSGEHLKDEVCLLSKNLPPLLGQKLTSDLKGTKTQVIIAGATAGLVSRFVVAPLDVVKIRLQLQSVSSTALLTSSPSPVYKGAFQTLTRIIHEEGVRALWKGNIPAEALYVTYSAIQFTTYRSTTLALQALFPPSPNSSPSAPSSLPPALESFVAGATAGAISTTATYPLDLLRTRFAAQGNTKVYKNLIASVRDISAHEGTRGFFRGLGAGVAQIVPYMGIFFAGYETLRGGPIHEVLAHAPFGSGDAVAGIIAGVVAKTAIFPLDLVRKRLQVQGPTRAKYGVVGIEEYRRGVVGTIREVVQREGVRGLYRGLGVGLVKAAPAAAVTMWVYERTLAMLGKGDGKAEGEI